MFAIDTNILVYAHNKGSQRNKKARQFLESTIDEYGEDEEQSICLPSQVIAEFINVITRQSLQKPLSLLEAVDTVGDYMDAGIKIIHPLETQTETFLELLRSATTRKKIFDMALAATLKDNKISGLYTVNTADFVEFGFLEVRNPL